MMRTLRFGLRCGGGVGLWTRGSELASTSLQLKGYVRVGLASGMRWKPEGQKRGLLTISYAKGPISPPLLHQTIPQHFSEIVSQHGDKIALISRSQNQRLSYRELDERSNVLAEALRSGLGGGLGSELGGKENGVKKGDKVCVMLGNSWEFGVLTYAVWKLGGVLVPLNPAFNSPQVISALSHLSATHLILSTETNLPYKAPRENISLLSQIVPDLSSHTLSSPSVPSLKSIILVDNSQGRISTSEFKATRDFSDLMGNFEGVGGSRVVPDEELHRDEICNIQFTSGTTSSPKAACLTHRSILNNGYFIGSRMSLTPSDIICCPPPLFHCFGSILGYMATATHGSAILFPSESFNAKATLLSIQEEKATALYGVATMFVSELELLSFGEVSLTGFEHLRTGIAAGSSVPAHLMQKLHQKLNLTGLTICYGMTETSPVSCMTMPTDPLQKRVDSVGKLLPHVEAKIVSSSDGSTILPIGEKGELVVSGYLVMSHYYNDPLRTAEVRIVEENTNSHTRVKDTKVWMHTGDEAMMDEEGYVKITGRIKDLIIRGGENIHPLEVENVLFGMREVSECSVVGVPDERYGEVVAAFVVVHKGVKVGVDDAGFGDPEIDATSHADEGGENREQGGVLTKEMIRQRVKGELSNHLVPKFVFWTKEYPKTASGKIQKFKLREMAVEMLKMRAGGEEEEEGGR